MVGRRHFLRGLAALAMYPIVATTAGCADRHQYVDMTSARRPLRSSAPPGERLLELVRCATLAANGHNTQPWRFQLAPDRITVEPDFARRTPAVDPDDHHLWASLGCATENLVVAAAAMGKHADVEVTEKTVRILLADATPAYSAQVDAIFKRQCTRCEYDGRALRSDTLGALQRAADGTGVELRLITEQAQLETVLGYVIEGNSAQMHDAAFIAELKHWIRFSESQALASGDGLFTRASGNPATPPWLGSSLFGLFFSEQTENDKYAKQIRSSAGIAVLSGERADPAGWFEVGRVYQRLALTMTTLDLRNAFVNQPVEVSAVRTQLAHWLGVPTRRPDLVLRFGRGPLLPYSFRRPVAQVVSWQPWVR